MKSFNHAEVESGIRKYWSSRKTYAHIVARNSSGKVFSFIDGPPYTSGKVHIGTVLNKSMKDLVLRWRRMQGYNVFDRAGYDMHGLPTEQPTMRKLGLHTTADIEAYGVDKFIEACRDWCTSNMHEMNKTFEELGIWMDFENAYQPIKPEFTDGVWFLIKRAWETGRLYEGLRTMAWDSVFETACAKHELEYKSVTDESIYVKFQVLQEGKPTNEYLIIWTTTPWTIPLNLAIMVNPEVTYARVRVGNETWIVAQDLIEDVMKHARIEKHTVIDTMLGASLEGLPYLHFFESIMPFKEIHAKHARAHTVVLSKEYVDTSTGTGLVHCAPGCGPEDYEIGIANGLPAFNPVLPDGMFPAPFAGLRARTDDRDFIARIDAAGALVAKRKYVHDYPHSERSKAPVIYRATKQWFFKISDLKEKMVAANEKIVWQPAGGRAAFSNWLSNLRDNSITKQRYWGTAVPIWRNDVTGEMMVIGSVAELEKLSGKKIDDTHKPWIDKIAIPSKIHPNTELHRIPDVVDVWVDAGSAAWNALDYPRSDKLLKTHYPSSFIIEGIDQYRGWFNLLMVGGFLAFDKPSFTHVYVHGYINDSQGRKMSKSLGNYITPDEVLPKYGVDALRVSLIASGQPGEDVSYGPEIIENTYKNLLVLWNTVQYLVDMCKTHNLTPSRITSKNNLDEEECYMLSRMASATARVTEALEKYEIATLPQEVQALWLELSRTYIQLTREKSQGDERQSIVNLLYTVLERVLILLAPVAPFITDALYQDLGELVASDSSVHEAHWPHAERAFIDESLEAEFALVQHVLTAGLSAREKLKQGVRWPLSEMIVVGSKTLAGRSALIERQLNVKKLRFGSAAEFSKRDVEPNFGALGKSFGKETHRVAKLITDFQPEPPITIEGFSILPEHVTVKHHAPEGYVASDFAGGTVYLKSAVTPELLEEGYVRELTRAVQDMRKDMELEKRDRIKLHISGHTVSKQQLDELLRKCNAETAHEHLENKRDEHIRDRTYSISCEKTT